MESGLREPQTPWKSLGEASAHPPTLPSCRYFLIERGKNMCGLAACASYPIPQV